ncbi:MAG: O-methyltransferase [Rubrobacteraceae bacterium]
MSEDFRELLGEVDSYIEELFVPPDEVLEHALRRSEASGMPEIQVSPNQGKLLQLLAEISGARRILEIGTLGGYSAIHFARALPENGNLISLELDERHAQVARENIEHAGLSGKAEVLVGDAMSLLAAMVESGVTPFDLIFIDADKEGYPEYLKRSLELSRPGTLILADNAIRGGAVLDPDDDSARATREFNASLADHPRLSAIVLPIIRERIDGLAIARVRDD